MPEKLPLGVGSIEPTSPTRSARHEVGTCVSDTRQTNRRRRVISTTSDCTPQQWRTCACQIFPPPRSLAPFDVRNLRPLGLLKTTAIPLRSPRTSDPAPRRDLALTGVSAPKDAPRSTSTSALHRARCGPHRNSNSYRADSKLMAVTFDVRDRVVVVSWCGPDRHHLRRAASPTPHFKRRGRASVELDGTRSCSCCEVRLSALTRR